MKITIDLATVPPLVGLEEADDFASLAVVTRGTHAALPREALLALASTRAQDPAWVERLDAMLDYAASKGWVDDAGLVRAHVEHG